MATNEGIPAPNPIGSLISVLEADYRQLAHDARKSEGFASFFSNADNQPEVKEAAERAVMKIRALADHPNALDQIRNSKELLKPLQLACDTKSARLVSQSLATVQKMVSNDALSPSGAESVITMLTKVEKMSDEAVQLKVLQTSLTLLQGPQHPTTEEGIAAILGLCFRALTHKGRKDTVTSTAAATVRQSVAIVFSYVDVQAEVARLARVADAQQQQQPVGRRDDSFPTLHVEGEGEEEGKGWSDDDRPSPTLTAAQKLLEDLIAIATGAPPTWLQTQSLPRTFIMEVIDFALANSSELFMSVPDFQIALSLRISQLLQSQLQDYLDAGVGGGTMATASFPALKATLRCIRTLMVRYHSQLGVRCGTLIQTMLRGLGPEHPLMQRIAIAQLVKQLLEDAPLVYFLFVSFDMQRERKLDAVYALVSGAADVVDSALKPPGAVGSGSGSGGGGGGGGSGGKYDTSSSSPSDDPADAIGALFQARSQSKEWSMDADYESAPPAAQQSYVAMLALDSLLHYMASMEVLTYAATEGGGELQNGDWYALSPRERLLLGTPREVVSVAPAPLHIEKEACVAMIERTWRATLAVLNQMLARSSRETLVLSLLRGYQWFTQACGVLELTEPRDAFLGALCQLALASEGQSDGRLLSSAGGGDYGSHEDVRTSSGGGGGGGSNAPHSPTLGGALTTATGSSSGGIGPGSPPYRSASMMSPDRNGDGDAGVVLTAKNVQAMRTLFNIAHRLANVLGPGWALVLETLNTLDRVLNSPKTTTVENAGGPTAMAPAPPSTTGTLIPPINTASTNANANVLSSDLAILGAAASQLFECTHSMSREAVVALLSGLRDVSLAHLPQTARASGPPKMYALNRMVEVLLYNVHRIYDLWGIFLSHVLEVVDDTKRPVRAAAIDALGKAIIGALAVLPSANASSPSVLPSPGRLSTTTATAVIPSPVSASTPANESTGGLEHMLLVALEALHNDDREQDVRVGVLRVLLAVLQRHGERLTDGWTPVFRLLSVVPGLEDPETVGLAFQSVQLIAADYMPAMPFARLKKCLEVAVAYGKQQTDLNVSLTTISLLWNVGDMLSRSGSSSGVGGGGGGGGGGEGKRGHPHHHRRQSSSHATILTDTTEEGASEESGINRDGMEDEELPSPIPTPTPINRDQLVGVQTTAQAEELLELIFSALQILSQDPRPEVRNSGARTLFAVVVTQGPRLSRPLWERCLWELLFPLLRHAFHMSATSSKEESQAALLGRSKGAQVRLVMHHSRNTEQKQWDETVVVAVGGMNRLLRAHLPAIAAMDGIEAGWDELMIVAESSLAGGRKEVAVAAVGMVGGVLGAHGGDDTVITGAMWARAMRVLDVGVEAATSAGCLVPLSARTELVSLMGALYSSLRPRFSEKDTLAVFRWTEALCRNPWSEDDATNPVQTVGMPPVQKAALAMLPALAPDHLPHLWPRYVASISRLVQPAHVVAAWKEQEEREQQYWREQQQQHGSGGDHPHHQQQQSGHTISNNGSETHHQHHQHHPPQMVMGLGATPGPLGTGANGAVQPPPKSAQYRFALNSQFLEKVIALLVQIYTNAPAWVRATTLADIVEALGRCMELRFTVYQEKLWRSASTAFNQLVAVGLPTLSTPLPPSLLATDPDAAAAVARAWPALAVTFENFLLGQKYKKEHHTSWGDSPKPPPLKHPSSTTTTASSTAHHRWPSTTLPVVPVLEVPSKTAAALERRGAKSKSIVTSSSSGGATTTAGDGASSPPSASSPRSPRPNTNTFQGATTMPPLQRHPSIEIDPAQSRADCELELSVLDALTDVVLTESSAAAPAPLVARLISVVDRGIGRPKELSIPQTTTGSNFSHVCVRKMFVLCSRPSSSTTQPNPTLEVARMALPMFLSRCDSMLRHFAEEARPNALHGGDGPPLDRPRLDEIMCVLEVIASMQLPPAVVDAVLLSEEPVTAVVSVLRARPEVAARGRERTHLLLLYSALCGCVTCKEPRVREMARDVLGLAGAELGLGLGRLQFSSSFF